jgi:hypothetical protein
MAFFILNPHVLSAIIQAADILSDHSPRDRYSMDKTKLLQKLERAWQSINQSIVGLTETQMLIPGVSGEWTVKDILAHISWWEEESLKHLPEILQGIRPPRYSVLYGGIDAFNAQMTELKRGLSLTEVRQQLDETHQRLVAYLQSLPDELFTTETRFLRRLRLDTYGHYPIHTQAIHAWREKLE